MSPPLNKNSTVVSDEDRLSTIEEARSAEELAAAAAKKSKILPCRLCLGLLEERYMESALESVSSILHTYTYWCL